MNLQVLPLCLMQGFENFMSRHTIELFEAALTSGLDDTKLRTFLAKRWFSFRRPSTIRYGFI